MSSPNPLSFSTKETETQKSFSYHSNPSIDPATNIKVETTIKATRSGERLKADTPRTKAIKELTKHTKQLEENDALLREHTKSLEEQMAYLRMQNAQLERQVYELNQSVTVLATLDPYTGEDPSKRPIPDGIYG